ncbi:MAG TPA: nuclear transport factor 2 family protein [Thermomicrobiales bacterium]|nr:nuclear transport factor 2 family protein [Thermomicrobiales bacterium]
MPCDSVFAGHGDPGDSPGSGHPHRAFTGKAQVRTNGAALFAAMPNFLDDLLQSLQDGDTLWTEWRWVGTLHDGTRSDRRGVILFGVGGDRIVWGRSI